MSKIIYCNDLTALKEQLIADGYFDEAIQDFNTNYIMNNVKKQGNVSVTNVRNFDLDLSVYIMLEDLGTYEEVFSDTVKHEKYKSAYPYHIPITFIDEDGVQQEYFMPKRLGEIA